MNQEKMLLSFVKEFGFLCNQISDLVYFEEKGPYLMILLQEEQTNYFQLLEATTEVSFLAAPEQFPSAFNDPDFVFKIADDKNIDRIRASGQRNELILRKVVPDTPACRLQLHELNKSNSDFAKQTLVINSDGKFFPATCLLQTPVGLN